ncbi:tripartite tricarboxylate transporter substrate binding protein [Roseococcus sp. YIM B11640]|uniref:tripartite tricarboxylate transporter substrate binding protein n=1 Tax=Roseococcus sp. YIM B11640 TaxID=3133973 RepID=UPI003C7CA912
MSFTRRALGAGIAALAAPFVAHAQSQPWPARPLRIVVPFSPGGSTDVLARRLSERLATALGQTVLVENRPGAGGTTGADYVAKSPADGYTLLMGVTGSNAIAQSLYPNLPYDTVRSFSPVSRVVSAPLVLVANNAMPAQDMAGYIAAAKAAPNTVTHATPGNGTSMHLTGELFAQKAEVRLVHVPYRGSAQAMTDLIAGQVVSAFADILVILPQIRAGAVRPLAVSSLTRHPLLPGVPTMAESGLPGFEAFSWQGLFAPAGLPAPVMDKLYAEVARAMQAPEIQESFAAQGFIVEATPPADFAAFVASETARWGAVVRAGNVTLG